MCDACGTLEKQDARRVNEYAKNVRGFTRALWSGVIDYDQFFDLMQGAIRVGLTQNWHAGAKECGIQPNEMTPEERMALEAAIISEFNHVAGFADAIEAGSKANGGKFGALLPRAELWGTRAVDVQNQARLMACRDKKLKWVFDPAKEHCDSCAKLNGKVKRASYWRARGLQPQNPPNPALGCGGWKCGCVFEVTDEPLSRGPLPNVSA